MPEPPSSRNMFQWKWFWISFLMYGLFYFLPLSLVPGGFLRGGIVTKSSSVFIGIWSLAGLFIISAATRFISKGITIKEATVAAIALLILWFAVAQLTLNTTIRFTVQNILGLLAALAIAVILSLGGAWFGGRVQKDFISKAPELN